MTSGATRTGPGSGTSRFPRPPKELILPRLLAQRANEMGSKVFVTEVGGEALSYGELYDRASRLANGLRNLGVGRGDRVVTLLPNSVDSVVVLCAAAIVGAIHVPLNVAYKKAVLQHALDVVEAAVLVIDVDLADRIGGDVRPTEGCRTVWRRATPGSQPPGGPERTTLASLLGERPDAATMWQESHDWPDVSTLLFTSGTTGASKAVTIPWLHLYLSSVGIWQAQELDSSTVAYSPWPINHISGTGAVYMSMIVGGSIVLREKWSTSSFVADVRDHGCTVTTLMGEAVGYVRRMEGVADLPLTHLFVSPVTDYIDDMTAEMGARYATNYNSTELCSPIGTRGWSPTPVGSAGVLRGGVEVRLVDENGVDVADGIPGEALFRTPDPAAMNAGYWGMPEASENAWRGGWFHTGDLLRRDPDGTFYFLGRLKDRLRSRGENVSADELEASVLRHPDVAQCAAVGRPNDVGEDDIVLFVVTTSDVSLEDIEDHCRSELPKFMWPAEIRFADELPETPTGKIRRAEIREALLAD